MPADAFRGKTLRWSYDDGPTAGQAFEHAFGRDGRVAWRVDGKAGESAKYHSVRLTPTVHLASYLAPSGWALTTVLDTATGALVSVASNEGQMYVQHGALVAREPGSTRRGSTRPGKAPPSGKGKAARPRPRA